MTEIDQYALDLTPPVRDARKWAGKQRVQNSKRKLLVIDYQTWLSLTDHLITALPPKPVVKEREESARFTSE